MGVPAQSFKHDNTLEFAAHWLINKFIENKGRLPALLSDEARKWLRAVQETRDYRKPHARTTSPHRFPATAWEALVVDWIQGPDDPVRVSALITVCVRVVTGSLGADSRMQPLAQLTQSQAELIQTLFDQLAGDSGKPFYDLGGALAWTRE